MSKLLCVALCVGILVGAGTTAVIPVQAQLPSLSELQPLAYQQERDSLRSLYRDQIQAYQLAYRQYTLDKAQYEQLQTLAALDALVVSTRAALQRRAEVLTTYVDLLHLELRYAPSDSPEAKQELLRQLETMRADLQAQTQLIVSSQDRDAIAERVAGFAQLYTQLESLSFATRKALLLGKVRYAHAIAQNQLAALATQYQENPTTPLKQGERQRAIREIEREFEQTTEQWQYIDDRVLSKASEPKRQFEQLKPLLGTLQSSTVRIYTLLEEAAQL